jgi:NAD(P)-dependent dehydrogenase (short-subunit alcohol dehydrogenase family)
MGNREKGSQALRHSDAKAMTLKAALVTGAARRIGKELALDLARAGFDVAIHCNRSRTEAEEVQTAIKAMGRKACIVEGDLAEVKTPDRIMAAAVKHLGPLSLLVNNASVFEPDDVGEITIDSWTKHSDTNLRAPVMLSQAFASQLPASEHGNIINIIDQRVWKLNPRFFSYTLSKAGLWTATRTLAQGLAPRIRVNAIGPGPALPSVRMDVEEFQKQERLTLLGRGTSPAEISQAVRFIVSQGAMTGQMIALDGGQHLVWQTPDVIEVTE